MNQTWKTIVTIIITAVVVGGGIYYWQQNKIQLNPRPTTQPSAATTPVAPTPQSAPSTAKVKSIDDYVSSYEKLPTALSDSQRNKLVKAFSLGLEKCSSDSEFCTPEMIKNGMYLSGISLLSDVKWADGKDHEFYFEFAVEGPPLYYGPFTDNILRLKQEASQKENFMK